MLGLISSDYLESRFGWFRQLCGADYFNAVLQFLQAERKIRLCMLVQQGLTVAEIKAVFDDSDADNSESDKMSSYATLILDELDDFKFQNLSQISEQDESTIFYTAVYIARAMSKKAKCLNCKRLFVDDLEDPNEKESEKELFLDIANRGGLTKPSDLLYSACLHSWALYAKIKESDELFKLLMTSPNPRSVFITCYLDKIQINECSSLHVTTCASGCKMGNYLEKVAWYTFNLKARNFVSEANDQIAKKKRGQSGNHKKVPVAKKAKKLTSK